MDETDQRDEQIRIYEEALNYMASRGCTGDHQSYVCRRVFERAKWCAGCIAEDALTRAQKVSYD